MFGVEVLKGSSQIEYGPHTTGGLVNYISTPVPAESETYLKSFYGRYETLGIHGYHGGTFDTAAGDAGFLLEIHRRENDGFKTIMTHPSDLTDGDVVVTTTLYRSDFHRNWYKLSEIIEVHDDAGNPVYGKMSLSEALATPGRPLEALRGLNGGVLEIKAYNRDYELYGIESKASMDFETAGTGHELEFGARYHIDEVSRFQWDDLYTQDGSGVFTDVNYGIKGGAGDRRAETDALSFFLRDVISAGKFSLMPGARYEQLDQEYRDKNAADTATRHGDMSVYGGGIGATYDVNDRWMVFGGIYRGYSVPDPIAAVKDKLDEETSLNIEFGTRYNRGDLLLAEIVGFRTDFSDLIVGGNIGGTGTELTENAGDIDVMGLETKLTFDLRNTADIGFGNPWWIAYTYTDAVLDGDSKTADPGSLFSGGEDGNKVPYVPDHQFTVGTGLHFENWGADLTANYLSGVYTTTNNTSEQVNPVTGRPDARFGKVDSRLLVDFSAYYRIMEDAKLFFSTRNLFDEEYMTSRHAHGPRAGRPFTVFAGFEMEL